MVIDQPRETAPRNSYKTAMRLSTYGLLLVVILAGCAKPQPSLKVLDAEVQQKMPKHLNASISESRLSPMKELQGTTLPEGSWQADLKVTVSPRENLYVAYTPIEGFPTLPLVEAAIPEETRSKIKALQPILNWNFRRNLMRRPADQKQIAFIVAVASPALRKEVWLKLLTEPRGENWKIGLLEGEDPSALFSNAKPKAEFDPNALVWGSAEQISAVQMLEKEKSDEDARIEVERQEREIQRQKASMYRAKIEEIRPAVIALREKGILLEKKYKREVQDKLDELANEYSDKSEAFERYKNQLFITTPDVAERNRLTEKASKEWWAFRAECDSKSAELQKGFRAAETRAKKETKAAIDIICKEAGIDAAEFGD